MVQFFIIICFFALVFNGYAQKRSQIRKYHVLSTTLNVTKVKDGVKQTKKKELLKFSPNGLLASKITYKKDGSIKKQSNYKYNKNKKEIEQSVYKGTILEKKTLTKYNVNGKKEEKLIYDADDVLVEKKVYKYNNLEEKVAELVYDKLNRLKEQTQFEYNKKGLLIKMKVMDGNGNLIAAKEFIYTY